MASVELVSLNLLQQRFELLGQGHVFNFWNELTESEQQHLLTQAKAINPEFLGEIYKQTMQNERAPKTFAGIEPPANVTIVAETAQEVLDGWFDEGLRLISENKVALLLLAGGQGTRLSSTQPKGMYDLNLPSHKSLFQLQGERLLKLQRMAEQKFDKPSGSVNIVWYVMTSEFTNQETREFFRSHNFFGLREDAIFFFNQGSLPCLTAEGKIIMDSKFNISSAPDGNGGVYQALAKSGALGDMKHRGVEYIHCYCVDNVLVRVADPRFIAYCVAAHAPVGAKVVPKSHPHEAAGVFVTKNGVCSVVEYSEISKEMAEATTTTTTTTTAEGKQVLKFNAANIANHFYTREFLEHCIDKFDEFLDYHVARKTIKCIDFASGELLAPTPANNGIKLELFIFDFFKFASNVAILQVERAEEFSPLKNGSGAASNSPEHCRADLAALHKSFLAKAGATFLSADEGEDDCVEISPLVSYGGEGLEAVVARSAGPIKPPAHFQ